MRQDLIDEYVRLSLAYGDWTTCLDLTPAGRRLELAIQAERMTDEQLLTACIAYALGDKR